MSALGQAASARRRHLLDDCDGRQVLSSPTSARRAHQKRSEPIPGRTRKQPATILLIGVLDLNVLVGRHAQLHDRVHSHSSTQTRDDRTRASRLRQILERLPDDPCCGAVCDDEAIVQRLGRSLSHFERALRLPLRDPPLGRRLQARLRGCDDTLISDFVALAPEAFAGLRVYRRAEACPLELGARGFG
jgi:hypothetical protein